jgi:hypothetical protein
MGRLLKGEITPNTESSKQRRQEIMNNQKLALDLIENLKGKGELEFTAPIFADYFNDGRKEAEQISQKQVSSILSHLAQRGKLYRKERNGRFMVYTTKRPENGGIQVSRCRGKQKSSGINVREINRAAQALTDFDNARREILAEIKTVKASIEIIEKIFRKF